MSNRRLFRLVAILGMLLLARNGGWIAPGATRWTSPAPPHVVPVAVEANVLPADADERPVVSSDVAAQYQADGLFAASDFGRDEGRLWVTDSYLALPASGRLSVLQAISKDVSRGPADKWTVVLYHDDEELGRFTPGPDGWQAATPGEPTGAAGATGGSR